MSYYQQDRGFRGGRRDRGGDRDSGPIDRNAEQFRKLFIGGLSFETTEDGLKSHFETWGDVVDVVVMKDGQTKRSRGFGFITYAEADSIDQAQSNRPHNIDGRKVDTKRAIPREESGGGGSQQSVTKMFVGGVKDDTTEEMVRETFAECGEIASVDMIKDRNTGKLKAFCFVTFEDHDSVDKAALIKRFELNGRQVEVKKAQPKGDEGDDRRGGRGGGRGGRGGGRQGYDGGASGYGGGYESGYGRQSYGGGQGYGGGYSSGGYAQGGDDGYGSGYGSGYGGGPMRGNSSSYNARSSGPYGSGYGSSGGYDSGAGGYSSGGYGGQSGGYGGGQRGGYGGGGYQRR